MFNVLPVGVALALRHLCDYPEDCTNDACWSWTVLVIDTGIEIIGDEDTEEQALNALVKQSTALGYPALR